MRGTFQNEIAHPQLGGKQFHFEMFLQFMEEQIRFWKCCPNTLNCFLTTLYVRVIPLDEGITEIRGPHNAIVEHRTHMLVMLLFEGVTWSKDSPKKFLSNLMDKMD